MSKIRINELARQLEVKSREVIDKLHDLGITEALTHSSSIDDDNAEKLRRYFGGDTSAIVAPPRRESAAPLRKPEEPGQPPEPNPAPAERRADLPKHTAAGASSAPPAAAHDGEVKT